MLYFRAAAIPGAARCGAPALGARGHSRELQGVLAALALLGVIKLDLDREALARLGGTRAVIVANHPTLLDVTVLLAYVKQASCVVKHSLWRNPFLSVALRAAGYIPSNDPEQLLRDCDAALERGESLIVFPEATRSVPGEPLRLHRGAATIALELGRASSSRALQLRARAAAEGRAVVPHSGPGDLALRRGWVLAYARATSREPAPTVASPQDTSRSLCSTSYRRRSG